MIPFPGESVAIGDAVDLTGGGEDYTLWGTLVRRAGDRSMVAGTTWRTWVFPGSATYLEESGLDCALSWVVEVASGTVEFTAAEMFDPTYADITTAPSTGLGTYTATGPATVVIPSTFTADQVLDADGGLMLEVVGVSGSATVAQVKLRVWPTAGVPGGWSSPLPSWSTVPSLPDGFEASVGLFPNVVETSQEASWDSTMSEGVALWSAAIAGPHAGTSFDSSPGYLNPTAGGGLQAEHSSGDGGITWGTTTFLQGGIIVAQGRDWETISPYEPGLVAGVDYIRPPTEVTGEAATYLVQRVADGSTGWVNANAHATSSAGAAAVPAATLDAVSADTVDITPLGGGSYSIDLDLVIGATLPVPDPDSTVEVDVPLPTDSRNIIVRLGHTAGAAPPAWPGGANANTGVNVLFGTVDGLGTVTPMLTYATLPPYRVWLPIAVETITRKLRQYHRDDGLGVAPPRAYGGASRNRTGRAYGYT